MDIVELKKFSDRLHDWAVNLQQHVSDSLEDYSKTRHVYQTEKISPSWARFPHFQRQYIYDSLEVRKGVEHARAFKNRIDKFEAELSIFVDRFLAYDGYLDAPEFSGIKKHIAKEGEKLVQKAHSLSDYVDIIFEELGGQKKEKQSIESDDLEQGWHIDNGQVFYNGRDLEFPSGQVQEVLKKLVKSEGITVTYDELDSITTEEKYRHHIREIRKRLKDNKISYAVRTITGEGYVLNKQ